MRAILEDKLVKERWEGILSLEPHLKHAGRSGGYSGPESYKVAAQALKSILDSLGVKYA